MIKRDQDQTVTRGQELLRRQKLPVYKIQKRGERGKNLRFPLQDSNKEDKNLAFAPLKRTRRLRITSYYPGVTYRQAREAAVEISSTRRT
jgi:hypothetical protein